MSIDTLKDLLLWSTLINYVVLLLWFSAFRFAHNALYRLHSRWFRLPEAHFDAIHYAGMGIYKLGILLLNLAPYIALHVVT